MKASLRHFWKIYHILWLIVLPNSVIVGDEEQTTTPRIQGNIINVTKPVRLKVDGVSQTSISLSWELDEPEALKQVHFRIYYKHQNFKDVKTIQASKSRPAHNLTELDPYTSYEIWVRAVINNRESPDSEHLNVVTDVDQPSEPAIANLTCFGTGTIFVEWTRPKRYDKSVDMYYIYYRTNEDEIFRHIQIQSNDIDKHQKFFIDKLEGRKTYIVKICAGTMSTSGSGKIWKGGFSEERTVYLPQSDCLEEDGPLLDVAEPVELGAGVIAGAVCAVFFLLLSIVGFVLWRRFFKAAYYYLDDPPRIVAPVGIPDWEATPAPDGSPGTVFVDDFEDHVNKLHADSDIGFAKEYEEIQKFCMKGVNASCDHSAHPDNKSKNRYLNIVAYDHSRVQLHPIPGMKKTSDYINANYIDGFQKYHAYIASQGPLDETFEAFWRMIWEQNVYVIVMITNLMERGRRKCDIYWPKEGTETYGFIEVTLEKEETMANYTIRTMKLKHLKDPGDKKKKKWHNGFEREILQFHYTSWPDHGVPAHPLPVLEYVKRSSKANPPDGGPIVVHCSAGVGRTGTYMVIDSMLLQMAAKREMNIFGYLKHIRGQRNHLVQTEEQYVFIHDALLEAVWSGDTVVLREQMAAYIERLDLEDKLTGVSLLEKQFKLVSSFSPSEFHHISAKKTYNASKNRNRDLLPIESSRVCLSPKPGVEGSDYINASWLHGHQKLKEFVITQHPTTETKDEFWRMLWDHNAQTVVLLSAVQTEDPSFPLFWPQRDEEFDMDTFRVRFIEEAVHDGHSTLDFVVSSRHDDYELTVRIIHCPDWPHNVQELAESFEVLNLVQAWHLEYQDGPLVVVDKTGGTEAATFCALTTLWKQLQSHNSVDVYQVAKLYHNRRPGIWQDKADYMFLYKAMASLIASKRVTSAHGDGAATANGTSPLKNGSASGLERRHSASEGSSGSMTKIAGGIANNRRFSLPDGGMMKNGGTVADDNGCVIIIDDEDVTSEVAALTAA